MGSSQHARALIEQVAHRALAGTRYRRYRFRIRDGVPRFGMLGNEIEPEIDEGEIVADEGDWLIQKAGVNTFVAHLRSLLPQSLAVGDRVSIKHAGFNGLEVIKASQEPGVSTIRMGARRLVPPADLNSEILVTLVQQLEAGKADDGRRGIRVLHDLQAGEPATWQWYAGDPDSADSQAANPRVTFNVTGEKYAGPVTITYVYGSDMYALGFGPTVVDDVLFDDLIGVIERHCDSSARRMATVAVLKPSRSSRTRKAA